MRPDLVRTPRTDIVENLRLRRKVAGSAANTPDSQAITYLTGDHHMEEETVRALASEMAAHMKATATVLTTLIDMMSYGDKNRRGAIMRELRHVERILQNRFEQPYELEKDKLADEGELEALKNLLGIIEQRLPIGPQIVS